SAATRGGPSGRTRVSHVCAFGAPPWSSTSSGRPSPQTRALTRRPSPTSTNRRSTAGGPAHGRPASSAFSRNRPSSSYGCGWVIVASCLAALELRDALLREGLRSLPGVLAREDLHADAGLDLERLVLGDPLRLAKGAEH